MGRPGELEQAVLGVLWDTPDGVVGRDVLDALPDRELAVTTVLTVLDRLRRKGLVRREREGRAYRYFPARSRADVLSGLMADALDRAGDREAVLARFVGGMPAQDAAMLRKLLRHKG